MPLTPATRLGAYEITAPLGAGGMGEVYRARDTRIGREVAVKVLPGSYADDTDRLRRFEQEARAAGALNHPNVLTLHDVGRHDGTSYLVCELLEGETLRERLLRGRLRTAKALDYAGQIARGLAAAHDKGIVHRDLKPENVFVTHDERVKILDFGLAKLAERPTPPADVTKADTATRHTEPGVVLGTAAYMSPEQVRGLPADHRSDVFSFGAILHEMLTGGRAFSGGSSVETMSAVLSAEPPPLGPADAPAPLARIVRRCLEKAPEHRFQSAHDLAFALESSLAGPATGDAARRPSWRPWLLAAAALAAGLAIGFFAARRRVASPPTRALSTSILAPDQTSFVTLNQRLILSPDGSQVAFLTRNRLGEIAIWVRDLSEARPRRIAESDIFASPFWSPDGKVLGFAAGGKVRTVDLASGATRELCDAQRMRGASWNRDGVIVFSPLPTSGLSRLSAKGGAPAPVTQLDAARGEYSHRWPYFLPDGRHFLYVALGRSEKGQSADLFIADLDGGTPRLLVADAANAEYVDGHLLFGRQGSLLAVPFDADRLALTGDPVVVSRDVIHMKPAELTSFSVASNGTLAYLSVGAQEQRLRWLDRSGAPAGEVETSGSSMFGLPLRISPDGRSVAYVQLDQQTNNGFLWVHDLVNRRAVRVTGAARFFQGVAWSPDSRRVVYSAVQMNDIREKAVDAAGEETQVLGSQSLPATVLDATPDSRHVMYQVLDPASGWDLFTLSREGGARTPLLTTRFNETEGRYSPDGRWIAFTSDESGRSDVYVMGNPPGDGRRWPVSTAGGRRPTWRADGRELYYISLAGQLMAVDVKHEPALELSAPRVVFDFPPEALESERLAYEPAPDGRRFLTTVHAARSAPPSITVVSHWRAGMAK